MSQLNPNPNHWFVRVVRSVDGVLALFPVGGGREGLATANPSHSETSDPLALTVRTEDTPWKNELDSRPTFSHLSAPLLVVGKGIACFCTLYPAVDSK